MTTFIVTNDEKGDIVCPLLKTTTTTSVYNDIIIIIESIRSDLNYHYQYDLVVNNKEKEKLIEISLNQ
ncbi:unnamed protein product [Rotaria sp. Silwood2]|nr:unnamed protein product [Rotaria sp. Silwood2]CAF2727360.1 unnamed protein product [Rotaria sp. Silwood2]CAF4442998.1 unnamed protein product [Rotaria sp. Silwood2]CAF4479653.1 unnamed protein product [Rotaria sp. Silwood2]